MSKGTTIDLGLNAAYNDLFSTQEERDNAGRAFVIDLDPAEISDFPNHPFHVRMDEEMERLVESVKERGVLSPVLVRPMPDGGYQMISGHRRKRAVELAEQPTLSCIVRELTDDEAIIIMVDSNLQREQVLPSEKAFAYRMKLDAMKRQGQRTDLTSVPVAQKSGGKTSRQILGEQAGESQDQVRRYIRLTNLIPELLDMVDNSMLKEKDKLQMALRPAVELSYTEAMASYDYLEIMELYTDRLKGQVAAAQAQRKTLHIPLDMLGQEQCFPLRDSDDITGKVVAVKPCSLRYEYRRADCQLILVTNGSGARGYSRGTSVYGVNVFTGRRDGRWTRLDILGEVRPECLPQWAKDHLAVIQRERSLEREGR